ncbi:MAG: periplasmic heavy metal sensor [Pseudohongiellaceae bacterium]
MNKSQLILSALILSLALNLIFIGGISYRTSNFRSLFQTPFTPNVGWVVQDLNEGRQAELEPILLRSNEQIRPRRTEMLTTQRRVNELIASDSFDADALNEAFTQLRIVFNRYQQLSHEQTIALLSELTSEERRTAQEFMQRRGPRGDRESRRGRGGPGDRPSPPLRDL